MNTLILVVIVLVLLIVLGIYKNDVGMDCAGSDVVKGSEDTQSVKVLVNGENAVLTINYGYLFGFVVGDSEALVKSRIRHLGLIEVEHDDVWNHIFAALPYTQIEAKTKDGCLMTFRLHGSSLSSVSIKLPESYRSEEIEQILKTRFGDAHKENNLLVWSRSESCEIYFKTDELEICTLKKFVTFIDSSLR